MFFDVDVYICIIKIIINMKSILKFLAAFIFASIIALTSSCSKDNTTTELLPTVTLTDSLGKNFIKPGNALVYIKTNISLAYPSQLMYFIQIK